MQDVCNKKNKGYIRELFLVNVYCRLLCSTPTMHAICMTTLLSHEKSNIPRWFIWFSRAGVCTRLSPPHASYWRACRSTISSARRNITTLLSVNSLRLHLNRYDAELLFCPVYTTDSYISCPRLPKGVFISVPLILWIGHSYSCSRRGLGCMSIFRLGTHCYYMQSGVFVFHQPTICYLLDIVRNSITNMHFSAMSRFQNITPWHWRRSSRTYVSGEHKCFFFPSENAILQ